jgi:4-hydroxy-4-methyl-2-oxoglutarate aldolase
LDLFSAEYYDQISERLYTAVLADILDDLGYRNQVMRPDIRPLYAEARIVGRATTMLAAEVYETPSEPYKLELVSLDELQAGDVVVCTTQGSKRSAIWGELLSTHTRARGGRGAIIDGLSRDSWGIIAMKFPVFATGLTPADSKGRCDVIATGVTIEVGGVLVRNGDLVVADYDGCLAIPQTIEETVIARAMQKVSEENRVRDILRQGASIQKVFKDHGIL